MGTGYGADYAKHHEIERYRDKGNGRQRKRDADGEGFK